MFPLCLVLPVGLIKFIDNYFVIRQILLCSFVITTALPDCGEMWDDWMYMYIGQGKKVYKLFVSVCSHSVLMLLTVFQCVHPLSTYVINCLSVCPPTQNLCYKLFISVSTHSVPML